MLKHHILQFSKMLCSGFLALMLLTPISRFYKNFPEAIPDVNGATDVHYIGNTSYSYIYEGFSYGKLNNEGYVNMFDYKEGMLIDILLMGSSHMEAFQVMQNYMTANLLHTLSKQKIYNIGISCHSLLSCAQNLKAAINRYSPSKYVIIEITNVCFTDKELADVLNCTLPEVMVNNIHLGSFRDFYRKYLRKYAHQYLFSAFFILNNIRLYVKNYFSKNEEIVTISSRILLSKVLAQMFETTSANGTKLVIAYHPPILLNKDGSLKLADNPEAVKTFSDLCTEHGIYFLNTSERFLSEYERNYTLPYGFFNTSVATGHLNKDGHRMFAEEIYKLIQQIEGKS